MTTATEWLGSFFTAAAVSPGDGDESEARQDTTDLEASRETKRKIIIVHNDDGGTPENTEGVTETWDHSPDFHAPGGNIQKIDDEAPVQAEDNQCSIPKARHALARTHSELLIHHDYDDRPIMAQTAALAIVGCFIFLPMTVLALILFIVLGRGP